MRLVLLTLVMSISACATAPSDEDSRDDSFLASGKADTGGVIEGSPEAVGVLRVANEVSLELLVEARPDGVGLTQRVADNIGAIRLGDDGVPGTEDDGKFTTLAQLDAVPFVGPVAFRHMLDYANAQGWVVTHPSIDTAPPTLRGVIFTPDTIDLTNGPQQLVVSLDFADDLSGVDSVNVWVNNRVGGDATYNANTNRWEARFLITNWLMGAYGISSIYATDKAWNVASCAASSTCGAVPLYATTFQVWNGGTVDTQAPMANAANVSQTTIDVSQNTRTQTITIATSDDVGTPGVDFYVTPTADYAPIHVVAEPAPTAGLYKATFEMPSWTVPGQWCINQIDMQDASGNFTGVTASGLSGGYFTVVNPGAYSVAPPMLLGAAFSPTNIDVTNAAQTTVLSLRFAPDIAGIADVYVTVNLGDKYKTIFVHNAVVDASNTLQIPIAVPRYVPSGTLKLFSMSMTNGHGRGAWADPTYPTMAGADIRAATVQVKDGN